MDSDYLNRLSLENPDVSQRYRAKLRLINEVDPFSIDMEQLDHSIDAVPPVTSMDIISYLVLTHSFYSKEQMKAYKSLQAYKYFESGFVITAGTIVINDFYVVIGKVKHSQRANLKPLHVWCLITKDGSVSTAHCTCMAGNSEVCSHIGAILFAAENANRKKEDRQVGTSCTDVLAEWPRPSLSPQVPIVPIHDMNWGTTSHVQERQDIPAVTHAELVKMLKDISDLGYSSVIHRTVEPFASKIRKDALERLPSVLDLFSEHNLSKSYSELIKISKKIDISISQEDISKVETATQNQSQNPNWFIQRSGRITASRFKAVCKTSKTNPPLSLIKSICYPAKILFSTKATLWGITHEDIAVKSYIKEMEKEGHDSFIVNQVGLLVSKFWPQFAASPDRLVFCDCCLGGCLEVKCPYLMHTNNISSIEDYLNMKSSCLVDEGGEIKLKRNHSYYYQCQMQIFVTNLKYCDFVIWSPHVFFKKKRILPDLEFWEENKKIALKFHEEIIMPELLGRYFTKKEGTARVIYWCICNCVDDGRSMIKCDGDDCSREWFHFECVGLEDTPSCPWYCAECKYKI